MLHPAPIKLIIFDNDGTLMDTDWVFDAAHKQCTGFEQTWELKSKINGKTPIEACRITCEYYGLKESPESLLQRRLQIEDENWPKVQLMPGAMDIVNEFKKRGLKMSIATASTRDGFNLKITNHQDLLSLMDATVVADEVKHGKPEPDLFLAALAKFPGIKAEEALVFEDSPLGIKAANRAGMPCVFVPDKHLNIEQTIKDHNICPTCVIESFAHFDFTKFKFN
ncbi:haloacid dehalogenase-like hydrolase family protein [Trichomonas vaginalis G3]|uniref:Haloacid dehalogenase-like hydrolase family protein n=1 Tax=Trichomonas vaginalis (strain ATCC PRA-98 / G3) TaxID=412133 RepID=A2E6J3_TRIV3|nr:pseudouridine 5'-phosphatase protein [Trichomonas vaginalis G3]EAY11698.1 haloacid dehalogenase-like hydrolase family protein [Trichomonas vaginalis G3]KAI5488866.1 pseudouridine 5'-phosphatase protein [Trichomonas vaginalis G3]|eukprot:XP_001323921.1 haloacid dehalogenase-like hydrolase family protein [Trichomonas vaginalis G3]